MYLVTTIQDYRVTGKSTYERLNVGLSQNKHPKAPKVTVQFVLDRNDEGKMDLSLLAMGDGETEPAEVATLPEQLDQPLTVVVGYDPQACTYEGSYRLGDGPWESLGGGKTDPMREAWFVRLRSSGNWRR